MNYTVEIIEGAIDERVGGGGLTQITLNYFCQCKYTLLDDNVKLIFF